LILETEELELKLKLYTVLSTLSEAINGCCDSVLSSMYMSDSEIAANGTE